MSELLLIETLHASASPDRRAAHLARMQASAVTLGWSFDLSDAQATLSRPQPHPRLRLTLNCDGEFDLTSGPLPPVPDLWHLGVAAERLRSNDLWLRHKTTRRALYDRTRATLDPNLHEMIFLNERDEVCEGTITNLFFDRGQGMRTPPLDCGLLPGILRAEMIAQGTREEVLPAADLPHVRLWVGNSLRGLIAAKLA